MPLGNLHLLKTDHFGHTMYCQVFLGAATASSRLQPRQLFRPEHSYRRYRASPCWQVGCGGHLLRDLPPESLGVTRPTQYRGPGATLLLSRALNLRFLAVCSQSIPQSFAGDDVRGHSFPFTIRILRRLVSKVFQILSTDRLTPAPCEQRYGRAPSLRSEMYARMHRMRLRKDQERSRRTCPGPYNLQ